MEEGDSVNDDVVSSDEPLEGDVTSQEEEEVVAQVPYNVTSYGADPEVESLVNRLKRGDIIVPKFQRDYVWRQPEASKFIESLLLGLPVPGLFLATEQETNKQLVIDGQQRLKTLLFFYEGYFNPKPEDKNRRVFALTKVQPSLEGKTYKTLDEPDRVRLDTSIIHATIVKQTSPPGDDTSLYHIFERLNSGGRRLTDQEIRIAIYHGKLIELIKKLNTFQPWREVFGKPHSRLKDQELILRFFALYEDSDLYERPLQEFLSKFAGRHQNPKESFLDRLYDAFVNSIIVFRQSLDRPFRLTKSLNVAVFDSCMVGMARRLSAKPEVKPNTTAVKEAYASLIADGEYLESVSRSTADEAFVGRRLEKATQAFSEC